MKSALLAAACLALALCSPPACAAGVDAGDVADVGAEIRFHPHRQLWSYPLETERGLSTLLVPNTAVVNRGTPRVVERVRLDLVRDGEVVQSRFLGVRELDAAARTGDQLMRSGMMAALDFQFSPATLFGDGVDVAASRELGVDQALYLPTQVFAFAGQPSQLQVQVEFAGGASARASLPIRHGGADGGFLFPLAGRWFVAAGATAHSHHRWAVPEEFALDLVRIGEDGRTHRGDGSRMEDYLAYGAPVRAIADGEVVAVVAGRPDSVELLRRPGESQTDHMGRVMAAQQAMLAEGAAAIAGNHVVLRHAGGLHSVYAHLAPHGAMVEVGQQVRAGQTLGALGGSGNSTEPHLHFHVCDAPSPLQCAGVPVNFERITLPLADFPRALQTGDIVEAD